MSWKFKCPLCGAISKNSKDAELGYCHKCNDFTRYSGDDAATCVIDDCPEQVSDGKILCSYHWSILPRELKKESYRWRYKLRQGLDDGTGFDKMISEIKSFIKGVKL